MRRNCNLVAVVLMLSLAVAAGGCAARFAEFEVSSLDVSPEVCESGDKVTVSATLVNTGNARGDHVAELLVNGAVEQTQTFTVEPGASQSLSFALVKDEAGSYTVQLEGLTASFTVLKSAQFIVSDLIINPPEAEVGEEVMVTVNVKNVGEVEGIYTGTLEIDGTDVEKKEVTVAGGTTETLTFTVAREVGPSCNIEIGGLTGTLVIKEAVKKLQVLNMNGYRYDRSYKIEGTVRNVSTVPLHDVKFEVSLYDEDGALITTLSAPVQPSTIEVWDTAHCLVVAGGETRPVSYIYGFVLPSGEPVYVTAE